MIVIDASACVDLALGSPRGDRVAAAIAGHSLHAPDILDLEVVSALARLERSGTHGSDVVAAALDEFHAMPVRRHSSTVLTRDVWGLRLGIRVSDAFYVAVARRLGVPLVTSDGRLSRGRPSDVEVLLVSRPTP